MRIAIVGSHATGKSTLVEELTRGNADLPTVDEPYYQLLADGHAFSDPPSVPDFETLFDAAVANLAGHAGPAVFDRSPADYLAYLAALQPRTVFHDHVASAAAALHTLDLIVYVPIEHPDRIANPELPRLRRRVDRILREMIIEQSWGWALPNIEVHGTPSERATQVTNRFGAAQRDLSTSNTGHR